MKRVKLTKRTVESADHRILSAEWRESIKHGKPRPNKHGSPPNPDRKEFYIWDTEIRGFGLLVLPTVKVYIYQYKNQYGKDRRYSIGKHGGKITPDYARKRASELWREVHDRHDPMQEKQDKRKAETVAELLDAYILSETFKEKAATTRSINRGRIERHLKPLLGKKHVEALSPEIIKKARAAIRDGSKEIVGEFKTEKRGGKARVTGGEATARDSIRLLRAVLNWAISEGRLKMENPAQGIDLGQHNQREVFLEDDEGQRLFTTLTKMEDERRITSQVADIIRVLVYTGARKSEIAKLRWEHVDLKKRGVIKIPPRFHKTGRKTGKDRIIPLPAEVQAIIAKQKPGEDSDFVFSSAKGDGPVSLTKPWHKIRTEAKLPSNFVIHGLRHTVGSDLAERGRSAIEIGEALGHRQSKTAEGYIHLRDQKRQNLAEEKARFARAAAAAAKAKAEGREPAEVIELPKKGG